MKQTSTNALSRRDFLVGLGLAPFLVSSANAAIHMASNEVFLNGHHDEKGKFYLSGMNLEGNEQFRVPLPEMPHGFAIHPQQRQQVVSIPGLTGTKAIVVDTTKAQQIAQITIRPNRHFNGHGCFSPDGRYLYTTENVIDTSEGLVGVYDGKTFEFVRELPGYGLGPHGIRIMPDGNTLVLASGGFKTDPKTGKFYANLNKMKSAVIFIDATTGKLLGKRSIPTHRLSIRNIYPTADNGLLVTCQYYGKREMPKLVGFIKDMGEIEMLDISDDDLWLMNNYTGGTVISGNIAAVSCPRGNRLTFWDIEKKAFLNSVAITDVSGIQPFGDGTHFLASAETGKLYKINAKTLETRQLDNTWAKAKWTNHMVKTTA